MVLSASRSEIAHDLLLLFKAEIDELLVTKDKGTPLCCHESKLVEALAVQIRQLDAVNFGSDSWRQVDDLRCRAEEVGFGRVGAVSRVMMVEETDVFDFFERIVEGHVVGVERTAIGVHGPLGTSGVQRARINGCGSQGRSWHIERV